MELRFGQTFWLDNCPPLDGEEVKRRPVILLTPREILKRGDDPVLVVATTTKGCSDLDVISMPNIREYKHCTSGLPEPCIAVPRWMIFVHRHNLNDQMGYLSGVKLHTLAQAVNNRTKLGEKAMYHSSMDPS